MLSETRKKQKLESEKKRVRARRRGEGPAGLIGRFRILLPRLRFWSKSHGYMPPQTTPDEMLRIWKEQKGFCAACGGEMNLLGSNAGCFDHDHETGEPRGFIHKRCNDIEGLVSRLSDEQVHSYLSWINNIRFVATRAETVTGRA
jgi:Recombination endonuclease VII